MASGCQPYSSGEICSSQGVSLGESRRVGSRDQKSIGVTDEVEEAEYEEVVSRGATKGHERAQKRFGGGTTRGHEMMGFRDPW